MQWSGATLVEGVARGRLLVLGEPLSFWGGVDEKTGRIIDTRHPQHGMETAGCVLAMPGGRGSSSSSSVLAELLRVGAGPCAIVLQSPDPILVLGALVAETLYGTRIPIVVLRDPLPSDGRARSAEVRADDTGSLVTLSGAA